MVRTRRHLLLLGTALGWAELGWAGLSWAGLIWAGPALAAGPLPQNGHFTAGNGQIAASSTQMVVNQTSARAIIDWTQFSIGAGNSVTIQNGSGSTLNRVTGNDLSRIAGSLSATGTVYLVNPAGVVVAPGGQIITGGGFVASTRPIDPTSFMAGGTLSASGSSAGAVVNQGTIIAGGDVVLVGQTVTNGGDITAGGNATLAAGNQVVLQVDGSRSRIIVNGGTGDVTNSGAITAAQASLQAAGGNVYALAGNTGGLIQATGTATRNGRVLLVAGGDVSVTGSISAAGGNGSGGTIAVKAGGTASITGSLAARGTSGAGGKITVAGKNVALASTARLNASGATKGGSVLVGVTAAGGLGLAQSTRIADGAQILASGTGPASGGHIETSGLVLNLGAATISAGQGGSWLIDPTDLTITSTAATAIAGSLNLGTNVTEQTSSGGTSGAGTASTGPGDLTIAAAISWSTGATLTLSAYNSLNIDAAITATGGGGVVLASNTGAGGGTLAFNNGNISFTHGGALQINGTGYTLVSSMAALISDLAGNPAGDFALAENLDAGGTLYAHAPVAGFSGQFEGLGNNIDNLTINSTDSFVGLFGSLSGSATVRDLVLIGGTVTGAGGANGALVGFLNGGTLINDVVTTAVSGGYQAETGGLVGRNSGIIFNSYAEGPVGGDTSASMIGGLVGLNDTGTITNSAASGAVNGTGDVGGLVGWNESQISFSYAGGAVSGGFQSDTGGLVGRNGGTILNSIAAGPVGGDTSASMIGGLVGLNDTGTVTNSNATGAVNGTGLVGGLVGWNESQISHSDASGVVTGGFQSDTGGLAGRNSGTIFYSFATGTVGGDTSASSIGGLVGLNDTGTITDSFATGAVNGSGHLGGLVGWNESQISVSYATGAVTGGDASDIGGLAGENDGTITNAYATGEVSGSATRSIGGLVGWDQGTISDVYSTGSVVIGGATYIGGLIGAELGITTAGYWDEYGSGLANGVGGSTGPTPGIVGLTSPQWLTIGPVATGVFNTSIWVTGYPFPVLKALPYVVITGTGVQTYGNASATVSLQSIIDQNGNNASASVNTSNLVWSTSSTSGEALLAEGSGAVANTGTQVTYIGFGTVGFAPRVITYSVSSTNALYGNGIPDLGITLNGILSSDAQSLGVTTADSLNGTPVTLSSSSGVGSYVVTISGLTGAAASDYVLAAIGNDPGTITITPRPITYVVGNANSVYGTGATSIGITLGNVVNGDSLGVTLSTVNGSGGTVALSATSSAGTYLDTVTGLTGAAAANYYIAAIGNMAGTLTIAPKPLTYSVSNGTETYGTGPTGASVTLYGVLGVDSSNVGATLGVTQNGTPTTLTTQSPVGTYNEVLTGLTGAAAANYVLAATGNTPGTLSITAKQLTYSITDATGTYGSAGLGAVTLNGVVAGDTLTTSVQLSQGGVVSALGAQTAVGSYLEMLAGIGGSAAGNYVIAVTGNQPGTLTITPKELIWAIADTMATYGSALAGTPSLIGVVAGDTLGATVAVSQGGTLVLLAGNSNVGTYSEAVSGLTGAAANNYTLAPGGNTPGTLTINPKALSWSVANATSVYGSLANTGSATLNGVVGGDIVSAAVTVGQNGAPISLAANSAAGSYAETVSGLIGGGGNYVLASSGNLAGTLTITPRQLLASVTDASSVYGTAAVAGAVSLSGVVAGDTIGAVVEAGQNGAVVPLTAQLGAGSYAEIVASLTGAAASNYTVVTSSPGTLTVAPKTLTWSVADASGTFGTLANTGGVTLNGVVAGDQLGGVVTLSQSGGAITLSSQTAVGSYDELVASLTGQAASNYRLTSVGSHPGTLTIVTASPVLTGNGAALIPASTVQTAFRPIILPPIPGTNSASTPINGTPVISGVPTGDGGSPPSSNSANPSPPSDASAPPSPAPVVQTIAAQPSSPAAPPANTVQPSPPAANTPPAPAPAPGGNAPAGTQEVTAAPADTSTQATPGAVPPSPAQPAPAVLNVAASVPPEATQAAASGQPAAMAALASDVADSAVTAGVATHDEAVALFNDRVDTVLAGGGSPAQAAAAAVQAVQQLVDASVRVGPTTLAERLGDALALGDTAALAGTPAGAALSAALAAGLPLQAALAQAAASTASQAAMTQAASVSQSAASAAATALSQGRLPANATAAATLVAALASGRSPAEAAARAAIASETLARMLAAATVPISPAEQMVDALANPDGSTASPTLVAALRRGLGPEQAVARAARADAALATELALAQTGQGDPTVSGLAIGQAPPGSRVVMRAGVATLVHDRSAIQLAAATVPIRPSDPAPSLASGVIPPDLQQTIANNPGLSDMVSAALAHGASLDQAVRAVDHVARAIAAASVPADPLAGALATGQFDPAHPPGLPTGADPASFSATLETALEHGASPDAAMRLAIQATSNTPPSATPAANPAAPTAAH